MAYYMLTELETEEPMASTESWEVMRAFLALFRSKTNLPLGFGLHYIDGCERILIAEGEALEKVVGQAG